MKNLLDASTRDATLVRLRSLDASAEARWGRMEVGQMICHLADPIRVALGELPAADASSFATRTLLKRAVLWGMPAPKGKVQTFAEIDQVAGNGTTPGVLADDLDALETLIERFVSHAEAGGPFTASPIFGRLTPRQWGRLLWAHVHHHLKQFGA